MGVGRLGFVADLLSSEVQVGYMNGLAITIVVGQLPKLFGFSTDADGFVTRSGPSSTTSTRPNGAALAVGLGVLVVLLVLPRLTRRVPAVLVAVVGATVVSAVLGARSTRGEDRRRRSPRACPDRRCRGRSWPTSVRCWSPPSASPSSRSPTPSPRSSFAARRGDEVQPDQEMIGMGAANIAAGFFQGFAVSTSGSRTAVAEQSGAKSQLTGVVGAGGGRGAAALPELAAGRPAPVRPGRGRHRRGALPGEHRGAAPLSPGPAQRRGPLAGRHRRRGRLRGPPGHRHRHRPGRPALLPPQLVASRRRARPGRRARGLAQHRTTP